MQEIAEFYQEQIRRHTNDLEDVKKQLSASSVIRLIVFCLAFVSVYFAFSQTKWVVAILLSAIFLFVFLVTRHSALQSKKDKLEALIHLNELEIKVLNRDFHGLPEGSEFKDPDHYFSQDIDLFGRGSFYQYLNRTSLKQGSKMLASILLENSIDYIEKKQEAIKELAKIPEWRQDFSAIASLTKTETSTESIQEWLENYVAFVPAFMKFLPLVFSIGSASVFIIYFSDLLPESALISWLCLGILVSSIYLKKIGKLAQNASKMQSTFEQYNQLLTKLEGTDFKSELLKAKKKRLSSENCQTSQIIKKFSGLLNSLDKNNNFLYLIFANGFLLRTLSHSYNIETWIQKHGSAVEDWFKTIAFFDAYNSLGNFMFNHPEYTIPVLKNEKTVLRSFDAGHPLLDPKKSVLNDFEVGKERFFIITGANMAGKSTFLRTVSLQIVMANAGLPVCASRVEYGPIKLITSMRTADSLTDDESYFFSELKRLKFIVDEIQRDQYFIVLDEILKGTNSTDKAKGSRKFVERLVSSKSTGIIATHDLSLCEVAKEHPQIENHYFDAEIIKDELHFDYKFKVGVCQNMNASFLLKKMGIVD